MAFNCVLPTNKAVEEKLRIEKKIFNDLVTNIGEFNKINLKVINELVLLFLIHRTLPNFGCFQSSNHLNSCFFNHI